MEEKRKPNLMIQDNPKRSLYKLWKCYYGNVYQNIPEIFCVLENCMKICSDAVCESIGSVIGNHLHNRHIKYDCLFQVFISWNGPTVHNASGL